MTSTVQQNPASTTGRAEVTRILVGYDGSLPASAAIEVGASLLPRAHAWIGHLWTPPFASEGLRRRLWKDTAAINEFVEAIEREGAGEASRLAAMGVTLAVAAGWDAEALVEHAYGGEGLQFTQLIEKLNPDVALVGSRGLHGAKAMLGSVSDMVVHYASRPVLVVPHPLLIAERAAVINGPVVVGWDGSAGAQAALTAVAQLFPTREVHLASVDQEAAHTAITSGHEVISLASEGGRAASARTTADTLARHARRSQAALIVVGSRGRSTVREILLGSVAVATLHHAHRPIMVVPHTTSPDVA
ncbi:universal stress protein [Paractinoplanes rishiriensis]|uniref:Universal stress protein n=1 Tax=Paractinoplanes rishiriensis TaxID=1050105 RepID=A0A919K4T8_9ACTN|nr:universal stress protein [Actinoplanes rishiriensis]GIF00922.1 universal stress protein [Actinoplanes rishiriensis]